MASEDEYFAIKLTDECDTQEQWRSVMLFGLESLLKSPSLLMECMVRRAQRQQEESPVKSKAVSDYAANLINELGLRFEVSR
jgi:nitroimidazol reductase NimA-like FMN-containing flavoprotein (pyridoxamine 5'-phosphate oxidase superfamily)